MRLEFKMSNLKSARPRAAGIINLKFKIINLKPFPLDPIPDLLQSHGRESFLYRAV